ncbi:hypothetical protein Tco_1432451, partial [Tanacetum coccineum]
TPIRICTSDAKPGSAVIRALLRSVMAVELAVPASSSMCLFCSGASAASSWGLFHFFIEPGTANVPRCDIRLEAKKLQNH